MYIYKWDNNEPKKRNKIKAIVAVLLSGKITIEREFACKTQIS